jgi:hypothetical protein
MGNSLLLPEHLLIPFIGSDATSVQSQAYLLKTLDSDRGENPFAASKMSIQDGLAV